MFLIFSGLGLIGLFSYQQFQKKRIQAIEGTDNPSGFIVEMNKTTGEIIKGQAFSPDKPVIRPVYQGDATTLFNDIIGPTGEKFTSFYDAKNDSGEIQNYKIGDSIIYGNVGMYNNRPLALKIDMLGGNMKQKDMVGVLQDGSLMIGDPTKVKPLYYQLVYDEGNYPPVTDVYLEIPTEMGTYKNSESGFNSGIPQISLGSKNLKKVYLMLSEDWSNWMTRKYSLTKLSNSVPKYAEYFNMDFEGYERLTAPAFNTISDNNDKTLLRGGYIYVATAHTVFFPSNMKSPFTPFYFPPNGNSIQSSKKFEAKYDVGQGIIDTYENYLPESLEIVVEDTKGYFNSLAHDPIQFTDKQKNPINMEIRTEMVDKNLVITIPKTTLKGLKANQVNMNLYFGTEKLNSNKILENYDVKNNSYPIPLTFYNTRKLENGETQVSKKIEINARINPEIAGEPIETTTLIGSNSDQLNVADLIKNGSTTIPGDTVKLILPDRREFDTEGRVELPIKLQSTKNSALTKVVNVPITITKGEIVTSSFFENQTWLIDLINTQFEPRKIDQTIYQSDLLAVKKIVGLSNSEKYIGEYIPSTIGALKNLEYLAVNDLGLSGSLPNEIGELIKLSHIAVEENNIEGTIPSSFIKLVNLSYFNIADTKVRGTIPAEFAVFPKLADFFVNNTLLVGQLPNFSKPFNTSNFSNTQLTYNSAELPPFSGGMLSEYDYSFLPTEKRTLQLIGNEIISNQTGLIKPFDQSNSGYFNLAIQKPGLSEMEEASTKEKLYPGHRYTIKDKQSGEVLYRGFGEETAEVVYRSNIEYQVTVDEAFDNPANNVTIQGKLPELKFNETPQTIQLKTSVNNNEIKNKLELDGQLTIFDNRGAEHHWQLKMTPSCLVSNQKELEGEYIYTDLKGNDKLIVDNQAMLIESGTSGSEEIVPISERWSNEAGLRYHLEPGNLLGQYQGTITWSLEDAP